MALKDAKYAPTRENRLDTVSHFNGTYASFVKDFSESRLHQRVRAFTETTKDDIMTALDTLTKIEGIAVIIHGAIGCSLGFGYDNVYSTNLLERDTILGGEEKLRHVLKKAAQSGVEAIFILGTPVVAINNDDSSGLALEAQDEFGLPVAFLNTDGFKSKTPLTGLDIVSHSLLKYFINNDRIAREFVNILASKENPESVIAIIQILDDLGIAYNILPSFGNIQNLRIAGGAKSNLALNRSKTQYLSQGLNETFGIYNIDISAPIGFKQLEKLLTELGGIFNIGDITKEYILKSNIDFPKILKGKKIFIQSENSELLGLIDLIRMLEGDIAGFSVTEVDTVNKIDILIIDGIDESTPVVIAEGQPFEIINVLSKIKPDLFITTYGRIDYLQKTEVAAISLKNTNFYGYSGILEFYNKISEALEKGIDGSKKRHLYLYKDSWLKKRADWYVKREVN